MKYILVILGLLSSFTSYSQTKDRTEGNSKMSEGIFFEAVIGVIQMKIKKIL